MSDAVVLVAAGAFAALALLAYPAAAKPSPEERRALLAVEVHTFSGAYATGRRDKPQTAEDESRRTQHGYLGLYRDGVVACNGNPDAFPSPSETVGVGPYTLTGYVWIGPGLAASNQTLGRQIGNVAGAGNNHRTNATATGEPTGRPPCPEEDPDAIND